jgi:trimethylamine:corrinoid methyltransferase-like protein
MSFLTGDQTALLRDRVFDLLGENGVRLDHPVVLDQLAAAGAQVDAQNKHVRFPRELLEAAIESAPGECVLAGRDAALDVALPRPDGTFHVRPGTGASSYLDPNSGEKRDFTIPDIAQWTRLADALAGIDFVPFPSPAGVPTATADVHALRCTLENTSKHVWVQPYSGESIEYLLELGAVAAGGENALRERSRVSFISCALTPLNFKFMDLEVMLQACPKGVPVHACSLPGAGTTSPITMPGSVLLAAAEILVLLTVAQTIRPGAPVVGTPLVFAGDMATGLSLQSSVEAIQGKATAVEFVKAAFGIPTHTHGWGSDVPTLEVQSGIEGALLATVIASVGCDVLGGAGQLEVTATLSPVQLVIDDEVGRMLRRLVGGFELNADTMAWEVLSKGTPGMQFLTENHTFRHCRESFAPASFAREAREKWVAGGRRDLLDRALARYESIVSGATELDLADDVVRELDRVVADADARLAK